MSRYERFLVSLPPPTVAAINAEAERLGIYRAELIREAILKAEGGVWPDDATLRENGWIAIDHAGVRHLIWRGRKPVLGEKADMTKCIASVAPPKLFNIN